MKGSPPHTREAPEYVNELVYNIRITPAYAGSTFHEAFTPFMFEDHPRIRGKHWKMESKGILNSGSPPHTREAPATVCAFDRSGGITPAYAGSTSALISALQGAWDHPRIRGKHMVNGAYKYTVEGSPPHTREARHKSSDFYASSRITPAYAGSTTPDKVEPRKV